MCARLALAATKGVLASSPWLLGYDRRGTRYWLPHVLIGASNVPSAPTGKTR